MTNPSVVVVVPLYRPDLVADELISWRQLQRFLGGLDLRLLMPEGLPSPFPEIPAERFPRPYFSGTDGYSRLLLSEDFYRRFDKYEFLLIYQLDALVFDSDLSRWCDQEWDYIGAPWWTDPAAPEKGFSHVGNGGLSLRRISAFLRVLTRGPVARVKTFRRALSAPDLREQPAFLRWRKALTLSQLGQQGARALATAYTLNEDRFWSERAPLVDSSFRIAKPSEALSFAFEVLPRECFRRNGGKLPFGCHGWWRYDREFWMQFLSLSDGP